MLNLSCDQRDSRPSCATVCIPSWTTWSNLINPATRKNSDSLFQLLEAHASVVCNRYKYVLARPGEDVPKCSDERRGLEVISWGFMSLSHLPVTHFAFTCWYRASDRQHRQGPHRETSAYI